MGSNPARVSDRSVKKMSADFKHDKLRFLPVQVISVDAGIILKRGCTEVKISGEGASEAIQVILEATGKAEVNQDQLLDLFAPINTARRKASSYLS